MIDIPLFKVFMTPRAPARVSKVLGSGYIGQGPMVEKFETALEDFLRSPIRPLSTSSGTHALDLAYHLVGLGPGDKVITTPLTCTATSTPLVNRGVQLVFADIDPDTGNLLPSSVAEAFELHPDAKAIVAVDWAGTLCNYNDLRDAVDFKIPIIQDAAHAFGAESEAGLPFLASDQHGDFVMFSFQAIKHLTTVDGGALVCPDEGYYRRGKLLRWYGLDRESSASFRCRQMVEEAGYKYHMSDVNAAVGLANITEMPRVLGIHTENAFQYDESLRDLDLETHGVQVLPLSKGSAYWLYTVLAEDRDGFTDFMAKRKIAVSPAHNRIDRMPCFERVTASPRIDLPNTEHFTARHVAIPVGWWLSDEDIARVRLAVMEYAEDWERERAS